MNYEQKNLQSISHVAAETKKHKVYDDSDTHVLCAVSNEELMRQYISRLCFGGWGEKGQKGHREQGVKQRTNFLDENRR